MTDNAIKPDALFTFWSADEAAECLDGLPTETSSFLWREIVPRMGAKVFREEPTYEKPLADYWRFIPTGHRRALNEAAQCHAGMPR